MSSHGALTIKASPLPSGCLPSLYVSATGFYKLSAAISAFGFPPLLKVPNKAPACISLAMWLLSAVWVPKVRLVVSFGWATPNQCSVASWSRSLIRLASSNVENSWLYLCRCGEFEPYKGTMNWILAGLAIKGVFFPINVHLLLLASLPESFYFNKHILYWGHLVWTFVAIFKAGARKDLDPIQ